MSPKIISREAYTDLSFVLKQSSKKLFDCNKTKAALTQSFIKDKLICLIGQKRTGKTELIRHLFGCGTISDIFQVAVRGQKNNILYFQKNPYEFSIENLRKALTERFLEESKNDKYALEQYKDLINPEIIKCITKTPENHIDFIVKCFNKGNWALIIDNTDDLLDQNGYFNDKITIDLIKKIGIENNRVKILFSATVCPKLPDILDAQKQIIRMENHFTPNQAVKYLKSSTRDSRNWAKSLYKIVNIGFDLTPSFLEELVRCLKNDPSGKYCNDDSLLELCNEILFKKFNSILFSLSESEKELLKIGAFYDEAVPKSYFESIPIKDFENTFETLCQMSYIIPEKGPNNIHYYRIYSPLGDFIKKSMGYHNLRQLKAKITFYNGNFARNEIKFYDNAILICEHMINNGMLNDAIKLVDELDIKFILPLCLYNDGIRLRRQFAMSYSGNLNNYDSIINLLNLSRYYCLSYDSENARAYAIEAEKRAKNIDNSELLKEIYLSRTLIEYEFGSFSKGIDYASLANQKSKDNDSIIKTLCTLAVGFNRIGYREKASIHFAEAFKKLTINTNKEIKARLFFQYGISEHENGKLVHSFNLLNMAYEHSQNSNLFGDVCCCLAITEIDMARYKEAKEHLDKAFSEVGENIKMRLKGRCHAALGYLNYKQKDYKIASGQYYQAIETVNLTKDNDGYIIWKTIHSVMLILGNSTDEAQNCLLNLVRKIPEQLLINEPDHAITRCYYSLSLCLFNWLLEGSNQSLDISINELEELTIAYNATGKNKVILNPILNYVLDVNYLYQSKRLSDYINTIKALLS